MNYIEKLTKEEYIFLLKDYRENLISEIQKRWSTRYWDYNTMDDFVNYHYSDFVKNVEEYKSVTKKIEELEE